MSGSPVLKARLEPFLCDWCRRGMKAKRNGASLLRAGSRSLFHAVSCKTSLTVRAEGASEGLEDDEWYLPCFFLQTPTKDSRLMVFPQAVLAFRMAKC